MKKLVRLWKRPSHDGQKYTYYLIYYDTNGRGEQKTLGHADKRKAEKQCAQLARELCSVSIFRYQFRVIMKKSGIEKGEFHDLRRTCLTNWLANGLSEFDVMTMAGHASFETTRRFYLAVRSDLLDRARKASSVALKSLAVEKLLNANSLSRDTQA